MFWQLLNMIQHPSQVQMQINIYNMHKHLLSICMACKLCHASGVMSTFIAKVMPKSQKGKGCVEPLPTTITLFCWILNVSDSPFPVDMEDSKTVGHLKNMIVKKKPVTFANVEADQLKLWKVSGFSIL
jgi:hypothetical protein